ncbi:helix-turn-helix domain-containing protein [Secundilactobacillus kimchicus]|uniref:helix-turn-helix domain-containing protein n=1 Tax=Secundilactobacillus kimchicus TaxID=528209 RepID=UPI0024A9D4A9|nr:XRE family transcriptional regulator [Secundilactobacillus kimchicus]
MKGIFNPKQLKRARISRGLTMAELSRQSGISRQSLSAYENGVSVPRGDSFLKLIDVLKYPVNFFSKEDISYNKGVAFFRSQSSATTKLRNKQKMMLLDIVDSYNALKQFINFPDINIGNTFTGDIDALTDEQIELYANELRKTWQIGSNPIKNLTKLMEANGIVIAETDMNDDKLDALSQIVDGRYFIALTNRDESNAHRRFSLAHELGHIILHNNSDFESIFELNSKEYKNILEKQANYFASCFLMPSDSFLNSVLSTSIKFFEENKKIWNTSIASQIIRSQQLGILNDDQALYLQKKISKNRWRKKEPLDDIIPVEKPYVFKQALKMLDDSDVVTPESISKIVGLPSTEFSRIFGFEFTIKDTTPKFRIVK